MTSHPSVEVALGALQARNAELERELAAARRGSDVESALDRVWTRALDAEHDAETLGIAVAILDALRDLRLPVHRVTLTGRMDRDADEVPAWTAGVDADGAQRASHHQIATTGLDLLETTFGLADGRIVRTLAPDAFEAYLRASLARYPASYADRVVARTPRAEAYHYVAVPAREDQSGPLVAVFSEAPSPEALRTLDRFAVLFGLAHAHHQALHAAEARARTSRLAAAAERVRTRALAMGWGDGLGDAVAAVFDELRRLGVPFHRCTIAALDGPARQAQYWSSDGTEVTSGTTAAEGHPFYDALWVAWRTQSDLSYILDGSAREHYLERLRVVDAAAAAAHAAGGREYVHAVMVPAGTVVAFSSEPFADDTVQAMQCMAEAFGFAFARHVELQASAARARERALAASVDRVRAEIASMRTAEDLGRVTPRIWTELTSLGLPFVQCGVFIVDEAAGAVRVLLATPHGQSLGELAVPFGADDRVDEGVRHWRRQAPLAVELTDDQAGAWAELLSEAGGGEPPDVRALRFAPFAQGTLYVGSAAPLSDDEGAAVQALADAFEVAYARYVDFQRLEARTRELEAALTDLRATQQRLVQSEKLASLGQLTAGIAHEIKNPLNFVTNFAQLNCELAGELDAELAGEANPGVFGELVADLVANAARIEQHGRRADSIVRSMMQHARTGEGEVTAVGLDRLVEEHVTLAYHGRRARTPDFEVVLDCDYGDVGTVDVVAQDIGRVIINLVNNAFDAVAERTASETPGFVPTVRISTARTPDEVVVRVTDNGPGLSPSVRDRVFDPFFTTKPAGQGTGLGLSMSHDIVEQGHGGRLTVESTGAGTTFAVVLPTAARADRVREA